MLEVAMKNIEGFIIKLTLPPKLKKFIYLVADNFLLALVKPPPLLTAIMLLRKITPRLIYIFTHLMLATHQSWELFGLMVLINFSGEFGKDTFQIKNFWTGRC